MTYLLLPRSLNIRFRWAECWKLGDKCILKYWDVGKSIAGAETVELHHFYFSECGTLLAFGLILLNIHV